MDYHHQRKRGIETAFVKSLQLIEQNLTSFFSFICIELKFGF